MFPPRHSPGALWNFRWSPQERQPWHFSGNACNPGAFGSGPARLRQIGHRRQGVGFCAPRVTRCAFVPRMSVVAAPRTGQMVGWARWRDQHYVESEGQRGKIGPRHQKGRSSPGNTPTLARQHRFRGARQIPPQLDLNDRQHAAAPRENVDLARWTAPMTGNDMPAAQAQMPAAQKLGDAAAPFGLLTLGAGTSRSPTRGDAHSRALLRCSASARS
jgi:hypothetical protein